ncbi:FG-GAP-like repeat-containing protein [Verrucomicrobia bacterium]|nr:FG-GAP-like repeat-containing protein [Verrucomicrobiota bacterium]MDA7532859.1 FG-GAP-like repeat-containing protein [Verrucomicrobiota bacterium]
MSSHKSSKRTQGSLVLQWFVLILLFAECVSLRSATDLSPNNPFYVNQSFPKLTTPQWIGEEGVEAVIILAIDDLRTPEKFEFYLRPILERLKQIDGRAPVSIYCNALQPDHLQFQTWLNEGLSLEVHTLSHPCPLLAKGNFQSAVNTVMGGIDLLNTIPGNRAVAYRMPCCDSINSPSPRFYSEIFPQTSAQGNFMEIDSSVMCLFTSDDKELPRELVLDAAGKERFTKYVPFPSFTTTIKNYPYPYIINNVCWEFPALAPSDWEAQNLHGVNNEITVEDWKRALDIAVIKQGVFTWIFHPHGWIRNDQVNAFIDYATETYGGRIKFLTFNEASDRLKDNLLDGQSLRNAGGNDAGIRLLDANGDGYLDVLLGHENEQAMRIWQPSKKEYRTVESSLNVVTKSGQTTGLKHGVFWANGPVAFLHRTENSEGAWVRSENGFEEKGSLISELRCEGKPVQTVLKGSGDGVIVHDVDGDSIDELIVAYPDQHGVLKWNQSRQTWEELNYSWPEDLHLIDDEGRDAGVRLVDINGDGHADLLKSDEQDYAAYIFIPELVLGFQRGWTRLVMEGQRGDEDAIPAFIRSGPHRDNGAWFADGHVWVQNEDTAHLPDLVQRKSFEAILLGNRPQPKDVDEALSAFELDDAFEIRCVASEPLIEDPVAFEWSADGFLWVAEMRDYPLGIDANGKPGGRIKRLKDVDGDGVYDEASVFLDGIPFPSGLYPWENGLWVSAAPHVFFAADLDDDGQADFRRNMFSGFGEGNQQHRVNGFTYGLDHWLYGANGDSGGEISSLWSNQTVNLRYKDFRFHPGTGQFEGIEGQTQFGRTRDDWGNWFGNNNPNWLWHYYLPDSYSKRAVIPDLGSNKIQLAADLASKKIDQIAPSLQRFNDVGMRGHVTSACSPTIYRDNVLFDDDLQHVFVSEPVHNLVRHFLLKRDGVTFSAERPDHEQAREFLASRDPWFRPTMTKTGPDGSLFIADMYRLVIEHTEWIPDDVEQYLNTRAGSNRGRIYAIAKKNKIPNKIPKLADLKPSDLVYYLNHENSWVRDTTQRLIIESDTSDIVPDLKALLEETNNAKARVHVLWLLELLGHMGDEVLEASFRDDHPEVRRNAVALNELHSKSNVNRRAQSAESVLELLRDPSPAVRFQAMLSISSAYENWKIESITSFMHEHAHHSTMRQALLIAASQYLRPMLSHVISCSECQQNRMLQPLVKAGVNMHPEWMESKVMQWIKSSVNVGFWQKIAPNEGGIQLLSPHEIALFQKEHKMNELDLINGTRALSLASHFLKNRGNLNLFDSTPDIQNAMQGLAMSMLAGLGDLNASEPFHAFQFLWTTRGVRDWAPWMEYMFSFENEIPHETRHEILKVMASDMEPFKNNFTWYGKVWNQSALEERRVLLSMALKNRETARMFLTSLKTGVFEKTQQKFDDTSMTQQMELSLKRLPDPELHSLAIEAIEHRRTRLGLSRTKTESISKRFGNLARLTRDASRGRQLFEQNCQLCHRFKAVGADVGPDLDSLNDRSGLALLTAILNPNEAIEQTYIAHELLLNDGVEWTVLITHETPSDLHVTMTSGEKRFIDKAQVRSIKASSQSLMPEGWGEAMSDQDLADLIGYLQTR